jgi:transcriptional regulator with XRE-family HTH domain
MTAKNKENIGAALKKARNDKGISMRQMASILGIKQASYIAEVENGIFSTPDTPKRFFKALGLKFYDTYSWRVEDPTKSDGNV